MKQTGGSALDEDTWGSTVSQKRDMDTLVQPFEGLKKPKLNPKKKLSEV